MINKYILYSFIFVIYSCGSLNKITKEKIFIKGYALKWDVDIGVPLSEFDYFEAKYYLDSIEIKDKKVANDLEKLLNGYKEQQEKKYASFYPNYAFVIKKESRIDTLFLDSSFEKGYLKKQELEINYGNIKNDIYTFHVKHYPSFIQKYTHYDYR